MKTAVVAIGGNAILRAGESGSKENQMKNLEMSCRYIAQMIADGYDIVLTHGNGPQVGNILMRYDIAKNEIPQMPLDVAVAESQGQMGYMIQQALTNSLKSIGLEKCVVSIVTQVIVDRNDPAFQNPTKPIGMYFSKEDADVLILKKGWKMVEDKKRGGWRRVVPSPEPVDIVEKYAIRKLVFTGQHSPIVVIASGGGGIPVVLEGDTYSGVEAVIDKDLASSVLASSIGERLFIMLTDVNKVALDFGKPTQRWIDRMTVKEAEMHLAEGHFLAGSMAPKIEAAIRFLHKSGEEVIITSPEKLHEALAGKDGTHIVP